MRPLGCAGDREGRGRLGQPTGDAIPFRFVDLNDPGRDLGTSEAPFGFVIWSHDGQRAAWCNASARGHRPRARRHSPAAPRLPGRLHAGRRGRLRDGNQLVSDRRAAAGVGPITSAHFGERRLGRRRSSRAGESSATTRRADGRFDSRTLRRPHADALAGQLHRRLPRRRPDRLLDLGCSTIGPAGRSSRATRRLVARRRVDRRRRATSDLPSTRRRDRADGAAGRLAPRLPVRAPGAAVSG